ncbi:MAG TPA: DUF1353 domain-containing protein [Acidimicrobiales bacterium]
MRTTTTAATGRQGPAGRRPRFWAVDSTPFSAAGDPTQPCRIVLRQVDDNDFELVETLVYTPPAAMPGRPAAPLAILPGWLTSDLASIPGILGWFARRHGRHTAAALVHDFLIADEGDRPPELPADWAVPPEQADVLFRRMLLDSGVPPVRSWLMWAAVTARTRWSTRLHRRLGIVAWGLAALVGTVALALGLARGEALVVAAALVAPVPASVLWGNQFPAGLIAGYAVWWALLGSAPAWTAYKLYQGVEGLVWLARRLANRARAGAPPPEAVPAPVPYDAR